MGLRQALMALMEWATNVPQKLSQCDAMHLLVNIILTLEIRKCGANHQKKL